MGQEIEVLSIWYKNTGSVDSDTYVLELNHGHDTAFDFSSDEDRIDVTKCDTNTDYMQSVTLNGKDVTLDLNDINGVTVLLASLTSIPETGSFVV